MRAIIVGGGLAGMTAAHELRRYGVDATIIEASGRLGGKAGADLVAGRYEEHGYHIFPAWYANVRTLLTDLGIALDDINGYNFLRHGEYPRFSRVDFGNPLTAGGDLIPLPDRLLYGYFLMTLLGNPLRRRRALDRQSILGVLRSRWYATEAMATFNQENLLKAVAVPSYELSAYTTRIVGKKWLSNPKPFLSMLRGNLQSTWIDPWAARLTAAGTDIRLNHRVTRLVTTGNRIDRIEATDPGGNPVTFTGDAYVLATNLEVARTFIDDPMYAADPELGRMHQLRSCPMSGLNLYFNRKIPGLPSDYVFCTKGRYELSFIDVSQHWSGLANTALCFISSDFLPLQALTPAAQFEALFAEIMKYLPVTHADLDGFYLQNNLTSPLFMNTIASWPNRPRPRSKITNLKLAGDYVKNQIDLATMEGAVSSAMEAAAGILDDLGVTHRDMPAKCFEVPTWAFRAAQFLFAPAVPPLWLWSQLEALR